MKPEKQIEVIFQLVQDFMGSEEGLREWLDTPMEIVSQLTPTEMIELGNTKVLFEHIIQLLGNDDIYKKLKLNKKRIFE